MKKGDEVIGMRLRTFRKEILGVPMKDVCEVVKISQTVIGKIERGDISADIKKLQRLNKTYLVNLNWLISGIGSPQLSEEEIEGETEIVPIKKVSLVNEPPDEYRVPEVNELKKRIETLVTERDLYKKLYEKQEVEIEFYKSKLKA
jgi:transcriptional regulator with XRE-family HTH domain